MIVVTGMHRSGTSLVCQLLEAVGVSFGPPEDRFPSDRWNAAGYFEQKAVMDANSRIVTGWPRNRSSFAAWCSKLIYLGMPSATRIAARAVGESAAIAELGRQYESAAVKDPRFCLTLGCWRQCAAVRHVVVCLRHPGAVLASLRRRDGVPRWLGSRFYVWHIESLLPQLPLERTLFVDVDRLGAGAVDELDHLRRGLGLDAGPASSLVLHDVVRAGGLTDGGPQPCPPAIEPSWQRLRTLAAAQRPVVASGEARTRP